MALPKLTIKFDNGNIGSVVPSPDGVFGLLASAEDVLVLDGFAVDTPVVVRSMVDVAKIGIVPTIQNGRMYKWLKEFFAEAGDGTELWIMGVDPTLKVSEWFTADVDTGKTIAEKLLDTANGKIRAIFTCYSPATEGVGTLTDGLHSDVWVAQGLAQTLAENYTTAKFAPFITMLEGYKFSGDVTELRDLTEGSDNRVGILIGDTVPRTEILAGSEGAATGVLAGRLAKSQVHINCGKVKDGSLSNLDAFIVNDRAEVADIETIHDKGYITFRMHTGKSGYYFTDDPLACEVADDYHYISRRRVIDKGYRIAARVMSNYLLDNIPLANDGTIDPFYAKTIEADVERAIATEMTSRGELSADVTSKDDIGVQCYVNPAQNVVSTGRYEMSLKLRPHAYGRFIDVVLGFDVASS